MTKHFEDDELLKSLGKAAGKNKAPKLDELIIHTAVSSEPKYGPRRLRTPGLILNLMGGAAILAGIFGISSTFLPDPSKTFSSTVDSTSRPELLLKEGQSLAAIAIDNKTFTEEDFLARNGKSLAEFGMGAVGNYISNSPDEYVDEVWAGQGGYIDGEWPTQDGYLKGGLWVFVVTDETYWPNKERLWDLFSLEMLERHRSDIATRSDEDGIRLLVQGASRKLHPLVIRVNNEPGSLYEQLLERLESATFTKVPNF
jgi:hypothetical protein